MEKFLRWLKAISAGGGGLKEIHSLVRDGTDRKRVNTYKTKPTNTKCIKKYCIVLSNTIEKYLRIDITNHVAYATYANT